MDELLFPEEVEFSEGDNNDNNDSSEGKSEDIEESNTENKFSEELSVL